MRQYGDKAWEQIGVIAQDMESLNAPLLEQCISIPLNDEAPYSVNYNSLFCLILSIKLCAIHG